MFLTLRIVVPGVLTLRIVVLGVLTLKDCLFQCSNTKDRLSRGVLTLRIVRFPVF